MPLTTNVGKNVEELYADNKKSGKARGNNGKPRSRAQIIAIAESAARKGRGKSAKNKTPGEVYAKTQRPKVKKKESVSERFNKYL